MSVIAAGGRTLAARLVIGFLVVTVPGTLLLAVATFSSIRSLIGVNRKLEEVSRALDATWALHGALTEAVVPAREHLLRGGQGDQQEFDRLIRAAEERLASCAGAACHVASRTPKEMAEFLTPKIEQLRSESRLIFEMGRPAEGSRALLRMDEIDRLFSGTNEQFHRMSAALLLRVEALRQESDTIIRRASALTASLTLAIILLACGVAALLARRITRPIHELLLGTRRVMAGEWMYRVAVKDPVEIGELAASFNAMVEELRRQRTELEEHSHTLEERVQQRTEELKRKDEALLQSEKLASLGLLASGVAHELNNPLTSILMNANLVMEELGEGSPLHKELKKIDGDAARCKRIIDDLREFSRHRELRKVRSRVDALVEQALRMVQHELDLRKIRVEREIEADLPEIMWDSERITQVLTNVFINAAQVMEKGGRLIVRARREEGRLTLEIRDTGPGIPPEHRSRIFDPFFTTRPNGTGLGLSISYGIVREHGGRIELESLTREEVGSAGETGTAVRLVLPVSEGRA